MNKIPSQLTPSTGMSPASSYQYLSAPEPPKRDDDASSTCSTDSRRPSVNAAATDYVNDQSGMDVTVAFQKPMLTTKDMTFIMIFIYFISNSCCNVTSLCRALERADRSPVGTAVGVVGTGDRRQQDPRAPAKGLGNLRALRVPLFKGRLHQIQF